MGCLHEPYHIEIDPEITPVINPPRKIPVAIKDRLKVELDVKFKMEEVSYCGHNFTKDGVRPDETKIKAIQEMPAPSSKKDVERLLEPSTTWRNLYQT